jgi:hypothetical protein
MKKVLGYIVAGLLLLMPVVTFAAEKVDLANYETMGLKETLESEDMKISYDKYVETDDQVTIYLFRGLGCGYCRNFLTFLNSITEEYGKYFKLVSFECWNNSDNSELLGAISSFLGEPAEGVPYLVIGDQVFPGFTESYGDSIKKAISTLYDTKKEDRYDVIEEYNKKLVEEERAAKSANAKPIIWNFIFVTIATIIVVCVVNKSKNQVLEAVKSQGRRTERDEESPKRKTKK